MGILVHIILLILANFCYVRSFTCYNIFNIYFFKDLVYYIRQSYNIETFASEEAIVY